jgi:hypothetical protein
MKEVNPTQKAEHVFASLVPSTLKLTARESGTIEFKESFNWGSKDKYAKSIASFANNQGGCLIFGVTNQPRHLVGLSSDNFENLDEVTITSYLNGLFSPEVHYEKFMLTVSGKKVGVIYVHENTEKPAIAIKNDGDIKEAEIYYRYNARNEKIKYPELKSLFESIKEKERSSWMNLFERVSKMGPANVGILDTVKGTIEGEKNSLLIDHALIPKLKFIKEGHFSEKGKPVLKLVGDVLPIAVKAQKQGRSILRITTDPTAPAVREETILEKYPLDYYKLVQTLSARYGDLKFNQKFYDLKKKLMTHIKYSRPRFLDPSNEKSGKKDFYSMDIIPEFDKHYTRKGGSEAATGAIAVIMNS